MKISKSLMPLMRSDATVDRRWRGKKSSQIKKQSGREPRRKPNQTIFNEEKQTMTRQYYVGKKLLGHCTIRVFAISKILEDWIFDFLGNVLYRNWMHF